MRFKKSEVNVVKIIINVTKVWLINVLCKSFLLFTFFYIFFALFFNIVIGRHNKIINYAINQTSPTLA